MTPGLSPAPTMFAPWTTASVQEMSAALLAKPAPQAAHRLASIQRLLVAMLVLAVLYSICLARPVLVPVLMAAFLAICLRPLVDLGERVLPRLLAAVGVLALVLCALALALSLLTAPAQEWLRHAPETLPHALAKLRAWLRVLGEASGTAPVLETVGTLSGAAAEAPASTPWRWWELLLAAPPLLAQAFSVVLLTLFFAAYGGDLFRRLVELSPTLTGKKQVVGIARAIEADTARWFLTTLAINATLGTATALMLWGLGIREPLLWGAAAALLNFLPYVGPLLALLLLALVGVIQSPTPDSALLPALCYLALTVLEGQFLAPLILGRHLSLNPVAILLWLMLWGWLWGIAGVILGVPMLMCVKLCCERVPSWRWLARAIE